MPSSPSPSRGTANERFKEAYPRSTYIGLIAAVLLHFLLFQISPDLNAADISATGADPLSIILPPEVAVPPPPEKVARPAVPTAAEVDVDPAVPPITFENFTPGELGPPEPQGPVTPTWIPRDIEPRLLNVEDVRELLRLRYPPLLRRAGVTGRVVLYVFVSDGGMPLDALVRASSGHPAMDAAALAVASDMRFSPARNRDKAVGVWILQAIDFRVD